MIIEIQRLESENFIMGI